MIQPVLLSVIIEIANKRLRKIFVYNVTKKLMILSLWILSVGVVGELLGRKVV
jgi:hypothetical protein